MLVKRKFEESSLQSSGRDNCFSEVGVFTFTDVFFRFGCCCFFSSRIFSNRTFADSSFGSCGTSLPENACLRIRKRMLENSEVIHRIHFAHVFLYYIFMRRSPMERSTFFTLPGSFNLSGLGVVVYVDCCVDRSARWLSRL